MMAKDRGAAASDNGKSRRAGTGPFFFVAIVATVLLVGATLYTLRDILTKGRIEQWSYVFEDAQLLPDSNVNVPQPEGTIRVFYATDDGYLSGYVHRFRKEFSDRERERAALERMFAPPPNPRFKPVLPPGTELRAFYVIDRLAYLDVSGAFLNPEERTPERERLAVYALVNGITLNSHQIDGVQILVEGQAMQTAWGWLDCSTPLGANLSVIR